MRISGIESLRATYSKEFVVELEPLLDDGKPWAVKLRQVRPIVYLAVGESIPVPAEGNGSGGRFGKGELLKKYQAMRTVVAQSISSVREAVEADDGTWSERWTPVVVLADRVPVAEGEMHIDEIDLPKTQNITLCWNALFSDAQIDRRAGADAVSFRQEGPLHARRGVKTLRPSASRVGLREEGS